MPDLGTAEIALLALLAALALGPAGGWAWVRGRRSETRGAVTGREESPGDGVRRFCTECGTRLEAGARFCVECGISTELQERVK